MIRAINKIKQHKASNPREPPSHQLDNKLRIEPTKLPKQDILAFLLPMEDIHKFSADLVQSWQQF